MLTRRRGHPEIALTESLQCGGEQTVRVVVTRATWEKVARKSDRATDVRPEAIYEDLGIHEIDPSEGFRQSIATPNW